MGKIRLGWFTGKGFSRMLLQNSNNTCRPKKLVFLSTTASIDGLAIAQV